MNVSEQSGASLVEANPQHVLTRSWGRWTGLRIHVWLVAVIASTLYFDNPVWTLLIGGALVTPAFLIMGLSEARKAPLWLSPLSFYFFWSTIGLGVSALYTASRVQSGESIDFSIAFVSPEDLADGYVVLLLGSLALHAGLQATRPLLTRKVREENAPVFRLKWLVVLWMIGLLYCWKTTWFVFIGAPAKPLQWACLTAVASLALIPRQYFGLSRNSFALLLTVGTAGLLVVNARSLSKAYIMYSFLPLMWMALAHRVRARRTAVLGVALVLFYLVFVAPAVTRARNRVALGGESVASAITNSSSPLGALASPEAFVTSLSQQVEHFLERNFEAIATGFLIGEVRKDGFRMGETMEYAAYAFVPRVLWPDKPNVTRGAWFTAYLGFAAREEEATTSTGITATGELYWNFGIPGVLIGMFGIGCLYGLLWKMAGENPIARPLHMLLYVMITIGGMLDMPEAVTVYAAVSSELLIFGVVFMFLRVHYTPRDQYASFAA